METLLNKIDSFLFDLMGLVFPGFLALLWFLTPFMLIVGGNIPDATSDKEGISAIMTIIKSNVPSIITSNLIIEIVLIILASYILGHVIKVFAILYYAFGVALFDKSINKMVSRLWDFFYNKIFNIVIWTFHVLTIPISIGVQIKNGIKPFFLFIQDLFKKVFAFNSPHYNPDNEILKTECINHINTKFNTHFPDKWYSLYKFSTSLINQNTNLIQYNRFLSKYNCYRSLSFLFFLNFFYLLFIYSSLAPLSNTILLLKGPLLWVDVILWFTFHVKYKRYWTLCGNQVLIDIYVIFKKNLL